MEGLEVKEKEGDRNKGKGREQRDEREKMCLVVLLT